MTNEEKNNPLLNFDPFAIGKAGIIALIVAFFVNAVASLSIAIILGLFGLFITFFKKENKKAFWLNGIVLILGILGIMMMLMLA